MMQQQFTPPSSAVHVEPAIPLYVLGKGWSDLYTALKVLLELGTKSAGACMSAMADLFGSSGELGCLFFLPWIFAFVCFGAGIVCFLFFFSVLLLFALLAGSLVATCAFCCIIAIVLQHFSLEAYRLFWRIYYVCPTPHCYKRMPLPIFKCPHCQANHAYLRPNIYGIWRHRCHCGEMLSTLDRFGRHKLARICPRCGIGLDHEIGQGTNIHLPLIGGPSAGKTHYMTATLDELSRNYTSIYDYKFAFLDSNYQKLFFQANVQRLRLGQRLAVTTDIAPRAYMLKMAVPGIPVPKILYMYDAAGEAFNLDERANLQTYYEYIHGLIFLIDPCAISAFHLRYEREIEAIKDLLSPSSSNVTQVYDRMMRQLEKKRGILKRSRYPFPIAVVVTKADALGLEQVIGADAARELMYKDPRYTNEGDAIDYLVRQFLDTYRLGNLMRNLDAHFSKVRYFSCSSLGRLPAPTNTRGFQPMRTLEPFLWLLTQTRSLNPRHTL